jgi:hypothetical protein
VAYTDAAGRAITLSPSTGLPNLNLDLGLVSGRTFTPGVYEWASDVQINTAAPAPGDEFGITLKGCADDVFIFKMSGSLAFGADAKVTLAEPVDTSDCDAKYLDGTPRTSFMGSSRTGNVGQFPLAANIFWQVATFVEVGAGAAAEGNILSQTHAIFETGSKINGRILAQSAVTLDVTAVDASCATIYNVESCEVE